MRWLVLVALAGCGEGGEEVGSASSVSIVEEVYSCTEMVGGVVIPGIGQTIYTIEACNEGFCYNLESDISGGAHIESVARVIDEVSSNGEAVDTVYVSCDSTASEVRIRYLAIE